RSKAVFQSELAAFLAQTLVTGEQPADARGVEGHSVGQVERHVPTVHRRAKQVGQRLLQGRKVVLRNFAANPDARPLVVIFGDCKFHAWNTAIPRKSRAKTLGTAGRGQSSDGRAAVQVASHCPWRGASLRLL